MSWLEAAMPCTVAHLDCHAIIFLPVPNFAGENWNPIPFLAPFQNFRYRLLKIEPNTWAGGKCSCAVCVDFQAVGALEFFGELYSLAKGFGSFLRGFGQALEKGRVQ